MPDRSTGPRCGNNPNAQLTDGDRKIIEEFRADLTAQAAIRDRIAEAARTVRLRLGPNAIAMAQRGEPIILNMNEADDLADAVLPVLRALTLRELEQLARPNTPPSRPEPKTPPADRAAVRDALRRADQADARAAAMERAMESTAADASAHRFCHMRLMTQCQRAEQAEARVAELADDLRYVLDYRGPAHAHEKPGVWDTSGKPCEHCARLGLARTHLDAATELRRLAAEAPQPGHVYLSTGCLHDDHTYCQSMTGL